MGTISDITIFTSFSSKRSSPIGSGLLAWPLKLFRANYNDIKYQNGLDAYFFVRFLRMMVKILVPIWVLSWIILLPVTSVGQNTGRGGLDRFTFGNVSADSQPRYAAHLILAWIFTCELECALLLVIAERCFSLDLVHNQD